MSWPRPVAGSARGESPDRSRTAPPERRGRPAGRPPEPLERRHRPLRPRFRPGRWNPVHLAYGAYAWLQFLLIGLVGLALLLLVPGLGRRRRIVQCTARLTLALAGMRVHAGALSDLPDPCVVVANHCSYVDGAVLAALLPPRFSFVIKREMSRVPLAGLLLRRIGTAFMERRERGQLMRDTRRVLRSASDGQSLVFFPEGTFSREIGLLHFHIGAFAAAGRAGVPLIPIAIHGSRHCLAPGTIWPRPGRIDVQALPPLHPPVHSGAPEPAAAARTLRTQARAVLLAALGEPDLDDRHG